jgi:hypothetical protein
MHSINEINEWLEYKDGALYWKKDKSKILKKGMRSGAQRKDGYRHITLNNRKYLEHRVIWFMHYQELPECLDHIDGNPRNNKIENLRAAKFSENARNRGKQSNNSSGAKNVSWHKKQNAWRVSFTINKQHKHIGFFRNFEIAKTIAELGRNKFHGDFAKHDTIPEND